MSFYVVVCEGEGVVTHLHLLISAQVRGLPSHPLYSKRGMMDLIRQKVDEGVLPPGAIREAIAQYGNWPIPPESGREYPAGEYWCQFLGYKRGRPLGLAGEPLRCQFVHWLGEGGTEYAVFRPLPREEDRAPVGDTPCPT